MIGSLDFGLKRKATRLAGELQDGVCKQGLVALSPDGRIVWEEHVVPELGSVLVAPDAPKPVLRHLARAALAAAPRRASRSGSRSALRAADDLFIKTFVPTCEPEDSSLEALAANVVLAAGLNELDQTGNTWHIRGTEYYGAFQPAHSRAATWIMRREVGGPAGAYVAEFMPREPRAPNMLQRATLYARALGLFGMDPAAVRYDDKASNLLTQIDPANPAVQPTLVKLDARARFAPEA